MNICVERRKMADRLFLVTVKGEIDVYTAPDLKKELLPLTEINGAGVTLDLSGTVYIDSTALGVIIAALKSAARHHCRFSVAGMSPRVERLFNITGLMEILKREKIAEGDN